MPNDSRESDLWVCKGKACRKAEKAASSTFVADAEARGLVVQSTSCLGACKGPTAVAFVGDSLRVWERLDKPKLRNEVMNIAAGATKVSDRLAKRELVGKAGRKALRRI